MDKWAMEELFTQYRQLPALIYRYLRPATPDHNQWQQMAGAGRYGCAIKLVCRAHDGSANASSHCGSYLCTLYRSNNPAKSDITRFS
jgi:hypothetical protein